MSCTGPVQSFLDYEIKEHFLVSEYESVSYGFTRRSEITSSNGEPVPLKRRFWYFDFTIVPLESKCSLTFIWDKNCLLEDGQTLLASIGFFKRTLKGYFTYKNKMKAVTDKKYVAMSFYGVDIFNEPENWKVVLSFDFSTLPCVVGRQVTFSLNIFDGSCTCGCCAFGSCLSLCDPLQTCGSGC